MLLSALTLSFHYSHGLQEWALALGIRFRLIPPPENKRDRRENERVECPARLIVGIFVVLSVERECAKGNGRHIWKRMGMWGDLKKDRRTTSF